MMDWRCLDFTELTMKYKINTVGALSGEQWWVDTNTFVNTKTWNEQSLASPLCHQLFFNCTSPFCCTATHSMSHPHPHYKICTSAHNMLTLKLAVTHNEMFVQLQHTMHVNWKICVTHFHLLGDSNVHLLKLCNQTQLPIVCSGVTHPTGSKKAEGWISEHITKQLQ